MPINIPNLYPTNIAYVRIISFQSYAFFICFVKFWLILYKKTALLTKLIWIFIVKSSELRKLIYKITRDKALREKCFQSFSGSFSPAVGLETDIYRVNHRVQLE